ncbi:MAG TPA: phosphoenolpyruvate carboxykinase (ATP), partial [Candidatus Poseidoniales archaeon]
GVLQTVTGDRTGRSPNDRFIVKEVESERWGFEKSETKEIWWGDVNVP